nr:MAG TPA: hypothetical protein [Caudoviricetes sp.]
MFLLRRMEIKRCPRICKTKKFRRWIYFSL